MRRTILRVGLFGAVVLAGSKGAPAAGTERQAGVASFPSNVELITVDAVVLDAKDKPIAGLTRDDFQVSEDGHPRDIASFEAFSLGSGVDRQAETPETLSVVNNTVLPRKTGRAFALIVDDIRIVRPQSEYTRSAVEAFIKRALVDGDEVTLGTTSGKVWWSTRIPEGRDDLLKVLERIQGSYADPSTQEHMTEFEAFWINNYEAGRVSPQGASLVEATANAASVLQRVELRYLSHHLCGDADHQALMDCPGAIQADAAGIDAARRERSRRTLAGVKRALEELSFTQGRTSLILFSPGFLLDSELKQGELTNAARDTHTAVYFVDVRGLVTDSGLESAAVESGSSSAAPDPATSSKMKFEELTRESAGAEQLADDTGGFTVKGTNDIASGARRIADESRVFYLLGFSPTLGKSPKDWHNLKVEVKTPGLTVRARKGYTLRSMFEGEEKAPKKAEKSAKVEPSHMVAAALESAHVSSAIPLRALTYVLEPRPNGMTHVLVGVEVNAAKLSYEPKGS